jgi:acyl carrier protein
MGDSIRHSGARKRKILASGILILDDHRMEKTDVLEFVCKHFRENVTIPDDVEIDPLLSMLDQGARSLDVVEITSGIMRELGVKVPRTKLSNLKYVDELVNVLSDAMG